MKTLVVVILDESGSMSTIETIRGFNEFLQKQKSINTDEASLILVKFNTTVTIMFECQPIGKVPELNSRSYTPGGGTALYDAISDGVRMAEKQESKFDRIICVIITDGEENSSHRTTKVQVRNLITTKEAERKWIFIYIGKNPDRWAAEIGMYRTAPFNPNINIYFDKLLNNVTTELSTERLSPGRLDDYASVIRNEIQNARIDQKASKMATYQIQQVSSYALNLVSRSFFGNISRPIINKLRNVSGDQNQRTISRRHEPLLEDRNLSDSLSNCNTISGLESLSRFGDITTERSGDILMIRGKLEMRDVKGTGRASDRDIEEVGFKSWKATIPYVRLRVALNLNCNNARKIDIVEYEYEEFSNAKIEVELNEHWGESKKGTVKLLAEDAFKSKLKPIIQKDVRDALEEQFSKFNESDFESELLTLI